MSRTLAISLKRPHEQLGLPISTARRLASIERGTWMAIMVAGVCACTGLYIYQVNAAASKSFALRQLEQRIEHLQDTVSSLDYKVTESTSIHFLEARIAGMGYIPLTPARYLEGDESQVAQK
jgi:hypothetical protein